MRPGAYHHRPHVGPQDDAATRRPTYAGRVPEPTYSTPWRAAPAPARPVPWHERNALWIDSILTLTVLFFTVLLYGSSGRELVYSIALLAPLAVRRRFPVTSVVLVYLAGLPLAFSNASVALPFGVVAVPVALYSVTLHGPRWSYLTAFLSGLVGCAILSANAALLSSDPTGEGIVTAFVVMFTSSMVLVTSWAFGLMRRSRRDTIAALVDRADRLERERDQQAQLATSAERTRIAREMHDIVAHSLSVIIAQADGGRYAAATDPDAAARTLGTIAETGRDALADMRRLLGVLRADDPSSSAGRLGGQPGLEHTGPAGTPAPDGAERTPQPASGDLETLVEQVRASGVDVSYVRMGTPRQLPPGVGLSVYRVCQESLTNVLKHAGPSASVTVLLRWDATQLTLDVTDDGRGAAAASDGAGHGLVGMRERATMFGGSLSAGPRPGGGFRVHLELPVPPVTVRPGAAPAYPDAAGVPNPGSTP
ncbi:signal transduction histidine kinase [Flavimobilis soli]|uniref:histidine kinase n=1 Tax=Flavimobilis soli TaxID=442709 RepID=A0A2A9EH23_9MICO|nr:signal transduction histidine kinase [Flavimobilis soli]